VRTDPEEPDREDHSGHHLPLDPDLDGADEVVPGKPSLEHWDVVCVVAAGGALGGLGRYGLNQLVHSAGGFPWATFTENVLGCLLLGALMVYLVETRPPSRYARPFLGIGVLGGFTTFSAYSVEIRALLAGGQGTTAVAYLGLSVAAGLAATVAGIALARALTRPYEQPQTAGEVA
jgi:fluoride exporter